MKVSRLAIVTAVMFPLFAQQQPQVQAGRAPRAGGRGSPVAPLEESGFHPIFDGKSLAGWDCDPDFWKVSDGIMIGETTAEHQPKQNIFCIWRGGKPADFELKLQSKMTGANTGNSGIQYRSEELPDVAKWGLKGYQADRDMAQRGSGQIYEDSGRASLAVRGMCS